MAATTLAMHGLFNNGTLRSAKTKSPSLIPDFTPRERQCFHPACLNEIQLLQRAPRNLNELGAELLLTHLHDIALPALLEETREELGCPERTTCELLQERQLAKLLMPTFCRWMRILGLKCATKKVLLR